MIKRAAAVKCWTSWCAAGLAALLGGCFHPEADSSARLPPSAPIETHPAPAPTAGDTTLGCGGPSAGAERIAATEAVEAISLVGGTAGLAAVADFMVQWKGDREMERHGIAALTRLPIDATSIAHVLAHDPDPHHRAWAAWTAGTHELAATGDALLAALKDTNPQVRSYAVGALAVLGDVRAQNPFMQMIVHDPDPDTRQKATRALDLLDAPHNPKTPIEPLLTALSSGDVYRRLDATRQLEKAKDPASVAPILQLLKTERDVDVRQQAISVLAAVRDEIAVPQLLAIARHDSEQAREYAIGALALIDDCRAEIPLIAIARDPSPRIRRFALRALAMLKRPESLSPLLDALSDPVSDVRSEAIKGISRLGDSAAAPRIAARLSVEPDSSIAGFECATLRELGAVGDPAVEDVLVKRLADDDPGVRSAAVGALGVLGTPARSLKPLQRLEEQEKKQKAPDLTLLRMLDDAIAQVGAR